MALPTETRRWIPAEWTIAEADGAQTDAVLIDAPDGCETIITDLTVTVDKDTTPNVKARIGWGTKNAPTVLPTAALTGVEGILLSHPDIEPGSGLTLKFIPGEVRMPPGRNLLFTCDVPTGGSIVITAIYQFVPVGVVA